MRPDSRGYFGPFGGRFVPETLMGPLIELTRAYQEAKRDKKFGEQLNHLLRLYAGRPTPLYFARNFSHLLGGAKVYLKREDLAHTGAHKINNALGQALLAKRMRKARIIAETGAGQHGVATATALVGRPCHIYMGQEDIKRQSLNVFRMRLLGAKVIPVTSGSQTLKDAINETLRDWTTNVRTTFYLLGSTVGPHPYPMMVRDFQSVIGQEARRQIMKLEGRLPDYLLACVGGGSNALGLFHPFYRDTVKFIGVEAAGQGLESSRHSASLKAGTVGVLHGCRTYLLQDEAGQILPAHSVAPGLDYPAVGPEHSYYKESGRAQYLAVPDDEALEAFKLLAQTEGIIPALESAHALAHAMKIAPRLGPSQIIIVNLSGRGDKDLEIVANHLGIAL